MKGKFEIRCSQHGKFYFVLKARNGATLAQSEMYQSKASCLQGIDSLKRIAPEAEVVDG